jgi:hypothetical protein
MKIICEVSTESPAIFRLCHEVVWVCAEARAVLRDVAADVFFNCWRLESSSDSRIRQEPRCVQYHEHIIHMIIFYVMVDLCKI